MKKIISLIMVFCLFTVSMPYTLAKEVLVKPTQDFEGAESEETSQSETSQDEEDENSSIEDEDEDTDNSEKTEDPVFDLFSSYPQDNKMLDIALEDFQQIIDQFEFRDLGNLTEGSAGSTIEEVTEEFQPSIEVEMGQDSNDAKVTQLKFVYKAEEGDLHERRQIEDWAHIELIFVLDELIFAGISTLSFELAPNLSVDFDQMSADLGAQAGIEALKKYAEDGIEYHGYGKILVNEKFYTGIALPIANVPSENGTLDQYGINIYDEDQLFDGRFAGVGEISENSVSNAIYATLVHFVPNEVFMHVSELIEQAEGAEGENSTESE